MGSRSAFLMRSVLSTLHYTGMGSMFAPITRGRGVIFTLHSVSPTPPQPFEPNEILRVTPDFLSEAIEVVREAGYEIISLDQLADRIENGFDGPPFACFTLDDGYRDNRDFAYPVFQRHGVPFAIYVPPDYADGVGELWWLVLEAALRQADQLTVELNGEKKHFVLATTEEKHAAFSDIYWTLRRGSEDVLRSKVREIADLAGYDWSTLCRDLIMTWDEIRALNEDPLVTIGAHTMSHRAVAKLSEDDARAEISDSVKRIEAELGGTCSHFSFPYGDSESAGERDFKLARELGLRTAVTTIKDVVQDIHKELPTGLPRISLNGLYQSRHLVQVLMTGVPFRLLDTVKLSSVKRAGKAVLGRAA